MMRSSLILLVCLQACCLLFGQKDKSIRQQFEQASSYQEADYPDTLKAAYTLVNYSDLDTTFFIVFSEAQVNELIIRNRLGSDTLSAGQYVAQSTLLPGQKQLYLPVHLPACDTSFLSLKGHNLLDMEFASSPRLYSEDSALSWQEGLFRTFRNGSSFMIFFIGVIASLFLYFFVLSILTPRKDFVFYSLYLFMVLLHYTVLTDYVFASNIFFPEHPVEYMQVNDMTANLMYGSYMLFLIKFLEAKKHSNFLYRYLQIEFGYHLVIGVFLTILIHITHNLEFVRVELGFLYLIAFAVSLGTITLMYIKIPTNLKYFVIIGSIVLGIASLIEMILDNRDAHLIDYRVAGTSWFSFNVTQAGIILEVICFSLGIGYKTNQMYREKDEIQSNLIEQFEENAKLQNTLANELKEQVEVQSAMVIKEKEKNIKNLYENQILELESELLRSQMNPHFIFNSLNSIKYFALTKESTQTARYITKFSKLMRMILQNSRKHLLSLSEEIEFLNLYLEIESKRFVEKFKFEIEVDRTLDKERSLVPPMLLQPIIENAIVHGVLPSKKSGEIKISFIKAPDGFLKVSIEDNGIGRDASLRIKENNQNIPSKNSMATEITIERINLINSIFDTNASMQIIDLYDQEDSATGTKVYLYMPLGLKDKAKMIV